MGRPNDKIGPYILVSKLGQGAFGVVWLAQKKTAIATTQFALKLPRDEDIDVEVFKQEAAIWIQASGHPNVLPLIDADIYDGQVVIVSEYIHDGSLASWLTQHGGKAPSLESACEIVSGMLAGLAHLHERRIIHRDLKPENILLQRDNPRVTDFGISRLLKTTSQSTNVSGTLAYMAPEAFDGKRNERTDIWAVGVIFYQLLAGQLPYDQQDMVSLFGAVMRQDPPPLPESVPEVLRQVVIKALQRDASLRYPSAVEMRHDLREAERMLWLQEREAREAVPTIIKDPASTLVLPGIQETRMPRMAVAPTIAAPTPKQPEQMPLETIKAPPPEPFTPDETPPEKPLSTSRRNLRIAIACVAGLVVIALMAYGVWSSKTNGTSQSQSAAPTVKNGIAIELVLVPAGNFKMGSTNGEGWEKPMHEVTINQSFYMGKYEVTQAQWQAVMGSNSSNFKGDSLPVEDISWNDAIAFIARLNAQKDGYSYRLPTEAEWEYACRAGTTGDYAGDLDAMAWYYKNSDNKTHDVGTKLPNAFGLFDMHGNVWEWCQDWYHDSYNGAPGDGSAWLSGGEQKDRVLRGGSWYAYAGNVRSSSRSWFAPDYRSLNVGFRVVAVR